MQAQAQVPPLRRRDEREQARFGSEKRGPVALLFALFLHDMPKMTAPEIQPTTESVMICYEVIAHSVDVFDE